MSDNDGYNVVASKIRQQMMVKDPILEDNVHKKIDPMDEVIRSMCRDGMSVSEAVREYTNLHGLPKGF